MMNSYIRSKGFRALINAAVFNGIGNSLFNIVFIIYAGSLPFKTLAVSLASFVTYLPQILNVVIGYYADGTHHTYLAMVASRLGQFGLFIGLAVLMLGSITIWTFLILLAINVISDCLGQFSNGLELPYFRHLVPNNELNAAMGLEVATQTTLQMIFQGIGAVGIVWLNYRYSLFGIINAVTFLAAAGVIWLNRAIFIGIDPLLAVNQVAETTPKKPPMKASLIMTGKLLWSKRPLVIVIIFAFLVNTVACALDGLINLAILHNRALWLGNYGNSVAAVNICLSAGTVLGALIQQDGLARTNFLRLNGYVCLSLVGLAASYIFSNSLVLITIVSGLRGYLMGKVNPRVSAAFIKLIPDDQLGRSMGFVNMVALAGAPLGSGVFLTIANLGKSGLFSSWLIFGITSFLIAVASWICDARNWMATAK